MTQERRLYWGIGALALLVLAGSLFMPVERSREDGLPWQIDHPAPGMSRIFDLTLGSSAAGEAERRFREEAKPSLFRSPDGRLSAEMFFEQVTLAGLKARIVVTIAVPEAELQAMYERGLRISGTSSGKKIVPAPEDAARLRTLPIAGLTYMPSVRRDEETITRRFGQPEWRIHERNGGAVHWLYPQHGLDIALGNDGKPVLQYVPPGNFDRLTRPLLDNAEKSESQRR